MVSLTGVSLITGAFVAVHLVLSYLAYSDYRKSKFLLLLLLTLAHLLAIPLIFLYEELISLASLPLILITIIGHIIEAF